MIHRLPVPIFAWYEHKYCTLFSGIIDNNVRPRLNEETSAISRTYNNKLDIRYVMRDIRRLVRTLIEYIISSTKVRQKFSGPLGGV